MAVHYIEAPSAQSPPAGLPTVFLAGGISGCPDWQRDAIRLLRESDSDVSVLNPRRRDYDASDPLAHGRQVAWEFANIRAAGTVVFWFCADTIQPIVLLELGGAMERGQGLVIGVDPGYPRRLDVVEQVGNAEEAGLVPRGLVIRSTLGDTISDVVERVRRDRAAPDRPAART